MIISNDDYGDYLVDKIESEGLDYAILHCIGRDLGSNHKQLNRLWAQAFDILERIEEIFESAERPE